MKHISYSRILIYLIGMIILACGLTMNTKVTLGVSPILSIPYALSEVFSLNFANLVFIYYCIFILVQLLLHYFVLHEKDKSIYISDILQILLSMVFTRIMNVVSLILPVFEKECTGFFASLYFRFIMLAVAILLTGIGAALTLNMNLIPNPGDGIVAALAKAMKKPVGTSKNIVDISCVALTCIFSYLSAGKIIGVGIGTLCAMLGVGRVINLINRSFDLSKYTGTQD